MEFRDDLAPWFSVAAEDDPATLAADIVEMRPALDRWTRHTGHGLALFKGANEALHDRLGPESDSAQLAAWYREDASVMTVLRVYALFDRGAKVSFQAVMQKLKLAGVKEALMAHYVQSDPDLWAGLVSDCTDAIHRFTEHYQRLDFKILGRLQAFRNLGVAHISPSQLAKSITYAELEEMVRLAIDLVREVNLMTTGLNTEYDEDLDSLSANSKDYWMAAIRLEIEEEARFAAGGNEHHPPHIVPIVQPGPP